MFLGDNQRKKSLNDKPLNPPITANFFRKSSIPTKQSVTSSVQNVSPISSHRGSTSASITGMLKKGLLKQASNV